MIENIGSFIEKNKEKKKKISTISVVICIVILVVGGFNTLWNELFKNDITYETNNFINEDFSLHSDNYNVKVNSIKNIDYVEILNKNKEQETMEGYFIFININIKQNEDSKLKTHKIDKNDFKLKDHTGIYLELNEFADLVGLSAMDLYLDTKEGNHIIRLTDFYTINALEDYNYIDYIIEAGKEYNFNIYFKTIEFIDVTKELTVLEVDFYYFANDYRKGIDIILLERKRN